MKLDVSDRWQQDDLDTYFVTNYTDYREAINVKSHYGDEKNGE
jgi:hypothetical protein